MIVSRDERSHQQAPLAGSELAEVRVSLEDIPRLSEMQPRLFIPAGSGYGHDGDRIAH